MNKRSAHARIRRLALLALALACAYAVYFEVPRVYFFGDDFASLLEIEDQGFFHFVARPVGSHINFVRQAIFGATFRIFGFHPEPHGWFTLGIHLLNVGLVFRVIGKLTSSVELSAFGAILWGTSPFHGAALSWYSDGQAVALSFMLVALDSILSRERAYVRFSGKSATLLAAAIVAGAASFGTGLASALASPVAVPLLLRRPLRQRALLVAVALVPVIVAVIYFGSRQFYSAYFHEPPTLQQQMLFGAAFADLRPALVAFVHFLAFGVSGLLRGLAPNASFAEVEWSLVAGYAALVLLAFIRSSPLQKRRMLALLLLSCAVYGVISLARANMSSWGGMKPEDLAADTRYQYAASMPLAVLAAVALQHALGPGRLVWFDRLALLSLVAVFAYSYPRRNSTLNVHEGCRSYVADVLRDVDRKVNAAPPGSTVYVANEPAPGWCSGFGLMYPGLPGTAAFFVMSHAHNTLFGRRVRFVEPKEPPGWAGQFANPKHKRLSELLVPDFGAR